MKQPKCITGAAQYYSLKMICLRQIASLDFWLYENDCGYLNAYRNTRACCARHVWESVHTLYAMYAMRVMQTMYLMYAIYSLYALMAYNHCMCLYLPSAIWGP